jgi:predicted AAA+ superfamily ATPase
MLNISRALKVHIEKGWKAKKVIVVIGPRQVGKTTLIQEICQNEKDVLFLSADDPSVRSNLENQSEQNLRRLLNNAKTVFIDEAQRVENIGLTAKIIHDLIKDVRVILSGSSALEIANKINEPLTGRKLEFQMFPVSWQELNDHLGYMTSQSQLNNRLIFGMYPEVITHPKTAQNVISGIAGSYLYKDLLNFQGIRKPEFLEKLLIALALQLGSEVNYNELSSLLRVDRKTIENYIHLLEQAFVIFKLNPLSRNTRNELNTGRKIYFYDNGVRNSLLGDFKSVELRSDMGALWENFMISERKKRNAYAQQQCLTYFWRTYQQQEVDYIEEANGEFKAYEFKWNPKSKAKFSKTFVSNYNPIETGIVTPENFFDFVEMPATKIKSASKSSSKNKE